MLIAGRPGSWGELHKKTTPWVLWFFFSFVSSLKKTVIKTNSVCTFTICCTAVGTISFSQIHITASGEKTINSFLPWLVYPYESVMYIEQFPGQPVYNFFLIWPDSSFSMEVLGSVGVICLESTLFVPFLKCLP